MKLAERTNFLPFTVFQRIIPHLSIISRVANYDVSEACYITRQHK